MKISGTGPCISAEALNKRWNARTVAFLKKLFLYALDITFAYLR